MREALRALWRGIAVFERFGSTFIVANMVAMVCVAAVIPAPAALAAIFHMGRVAQTSPTVHLDDFWSGLRTHFRASLLLAAINIAVFAVLYVNFNTFALQTSPFFTALRFVWVFAGLVWIAMQFYFWPMYEALETPNVGTALYNAGLMVLQNPYFTGVFLAAVLLILTLSVLVVVPLVLMSLSMIACIANAAVLNRLDAFRAARH